MNKENCFLDVEDLQKLISNMKSPPNLLTLEDFRDKYYLECNPKFSINPHRCRKDNDISNQTMQDLRLRVEGVRDCSGCFCSDCKVYKIVKWIKYLHPIVYQHGQDEISRCVTKKFMMCCAPLFKECSQHHRHKGDPGVTPGTCGAIGERAQVILVWVKAPWLQERLPPMEIKSHKG